VVEPINSDIMKKLLVALMAVLMFAACGEKKEVAKTPGDVLTLTSNVFESAAAKMEVAENADDIINAMEEMNDKIKSFDEKYNDIMAELENMEDAQVEEMYSKEVEALNAAFVRYYEVLMAKMELMENLTPEQQERWEELLSVE
jgi:ABC-type glycerol-3-phosphate transport system substrate-binding protein